MQSARVLSFFEPRTFHLFSNALLGLSVRPIFPAWQRMQLVHHGFARLLFLFFRGRRRCVFGQGGRGFVFFVRVRGLSSFQFFLYVIQFISKGFDQGIFFDRVEWRDSSATDVVVRPSVRSFPKWGPPTTVPCKIASVD